ncbi:MAG: hypothetical protein JW940_05840 [Polyangiaceae bacterium]|nr:hypothetical protein [Polyangiaceae bacterium]
MAVASSRPRPLRAAALGGLVLLGCGGGLRTMPTGLPTEQGAPSVVDYLPPPARIEFTGPDPGPPCYWLDGYWRWAGRRWQWFPGGWFERPPGCAISRSILAFLPKESGGATLYYFAPTWFRQTGEVEAPCPEPKLCRAAGEES